MRYKNWSTLCIGKHEKEVFFSKVTVSLYLNTLVKTVMISTLKRQHDSYIRKCLFLFLFNISIDANSVDPDQTAPIGAVLSGSTLFVTEVS